MPAELTNALSNGITDWTSGLTDMLVIVVPLALGFIIIPSLVFAAVKYFRGLVQN